MAVIAMHSHMTGIISHESPVKMTPRANADIAAPIYELKSKTPTRVDTIFLCAYDNGIKDRRMLLHPKVMAEITASAIMLITFDR